MSTTQFTRKEVVARKEYSNSCYDHLDFGLIKVRDGKKTIDLKEAEDLSITAEDIVTLQAACDKDWKILPGEKHIYVTGIYEDEFYTCRFSIEVSAILHKYDLWYEE